MNYKLFFFTLICFAKTFVCFSQNGAPYKWWDPAENPFPVIEGQAWPKEVKNKYDRFPSRAAETLNPNVWNMKKWEPNWQII